MISKNLNNKRILESSSFHCDSTTIDSETAAKVHPDHDNRCVSKFISQLSAKG